VLSLAKIVEEKVESGSYIKVQGNWPAEGAAEQASVGKRTLRHLTMKARIKAIGQLVKQSYANWTEDKGSRMGAALSYYAVFSLAPMLLIAIAIAGLVFGEKAAQGAILREIQGIAGAQAGRAIQAMVEAARKPNAGVLASVLSGITLLMGAAGVFGEIQDALDTMWRTPRPKTSGVKQFVKSRFLSWVTVLGTGFLLLVSMVLSAALTAAQSYMEGMLPMSGVIMHVLELAVSLGIITLLFGMIFKVLPQASVAWSDVWIGAAATAIMFTVGKFLIGLYIGKSVSMSVYGAAGSLVLVIAWVYYSAQILYFGAEFTKAYANQFGSHVKTEQTGH
jgi:membrane protein